MVLNCIFLKNTCLGVGDIFCTLGRIHLSICSLGANCFEASPPEGRPRINCFAECPTRSGRNWTEHYMCGVPTFKVSLKSESLRARRDLRHYLQTVSIVGLYISIFKINIIFETTSYLKEIPLLFGYIFHKFKLRKALGL